MAVNGVVIREGQTWITGGGERVVIHKIGDNTSAFPVIASHCTTTLDGRAWLHCPTANDLVRLADEPEQTETADTDNLAAETLLGLGWTFNGQAWVQDRPDAYDSLASVLDRALLQASQGKGKERHATGDTRFEDQPMGVINKQIGSIDGYIYQAHKKSLEALRLPAGRDVAELLGAINYLAGAIIALESWAKKN